MKQFNQSISKFNTGQQIVLTRIFKEHYDDETDILDFWGETYNNWVVCGFGYYLQDHDVLSKLTIYDDDFDVDDDAIISLIRRFKNFNWYEAKILIMTEILLFDLANTDADD